MPRKMKSAGSRLGTKPRPPKAARGEADLPEAAPLAGHVIERPDGFYWEKAEGESHGPYATLAEAEADMLADGAADELDGTESLQEAESELGISEWIDPDTGGPAEDSVPRIEDH
jgi:hypothetical protein